MKVLIVGLGSIAKKHINALLKIASDIEIFALRSKAGGAPEPNVTSIHDLQLAREIDFDFIMISNPTYLHKESIAQFVSFDKPLFIEKPLASSLDLEQTLSLISTHNIRTYVGCNLRFLNVLNYVKDNYININFRINEVNSYCGSYLPEWRKGVDFKQSYSASEEKGGGVHLDLIHEIDYLYWFFGKPMEVSRSIKSNSSLGIKSADFANYVLDYGSFTASVILNYYRRDSKRSLELVTDKCTIIVDLLRSEVFENDVLVYKSTQKIQDTYLDQLNWFIENLKTNNEKKFNDVYEAFEVLKISLGDDT